EEGTDLPAHAGAQLDQLAWPRARDDLVGHLLEQPLLGAGLVVLGRSRDLLEQRRPAVVVEVLAGKRGKGPLQAFTDLFCHERDVFETDGAKRLHVPVLLARPHRRPGTQPPSEHAVSLEKLDDRGWSGTDLQAPDREGRGPSFEPSMPA